MRVETPGPVTGTDSDSQYKTKQFKIVNNN